MEDVGEKEMWRSGIANATTSGGQVRDAHKAEKKRE